MDDQLSLSIGVLIGLILAAMAFASFALQGEATAYFVCKSHGLELIDYEIKSPSFSKVECGSPKIIQDENYKVFTND